jgi:hypothetical protein
MQNILDFIVPLFVLISVIAGMINSAKQAAAKNAAPPQPRPPLTPAQESMGRFLDGLPLEDRQQTASQRPQNQPNQGSRQQRQRQPQKKNPQKQPAASKQQAKSQQQPQKGQKPRSMGSGVAEHVDSFIGDHVRSHMGRDVDNFVKRDIDERVRSHLGSQSSKPVEMSASDTGSAAADDILSVLKTPAGVRHAILVNEILSRPRSLRKK